MITYLNINSYRKCILLNLRKLQKCQDEKPKLILDFIKIIEKASRDLSFLKLEDQLNNIVVVTDLEKKMSPKMREKWVEIVTGEKKEVFKSAQFPLLLIFLKSIKIRLEYDMDDIRNSDEKEDTPKIYGVPDIKVTDGDERNQ